MYGSHAQVWLDLNEYDILVPYHSDAEIRDNQALSRISQVLFADAKRKMEWDVSIAYGEFDIDQLEAEISTQGQSFGLGIVEDYMLKVKISLLEDMRDDLERTANTPRPQ